MKIFSKVNNKDIRTTSLMLFWCLYCSLWTDFTLFWCFCWLSASKCQLLSHSGLINVKSQQEVVMKATREWKQYGKYLKDLHVLSVFPPLTRDNLLIITIYQNSFFRVSFNQHISLLTWKILTIWLANKNTVLALL